MPKDVCARNYLSAVQRFDRHCGSNTCLRQIHFVDVSDDMVNVIQKTMTQNWMTDVEPNVAMKSSDRKQSQSPPAQEVLKPSESNKGSPAASTPTGNSFQAEQEPRIPVLKTFLGGSKHKDVEFQFQFHGLDLALVFRLGKVADTKTEAVVLWQEINSVGNDKNSKELMKSLSPLALKTVKELMLGLTAKGSLQYADIDSKFLVFPVVHSVLDKEKVQKFVELSLHMVDMHGKKSVTIPTYPYKSKGRFL